MMGETSIKEDFMHTIRIARQLTVERAMELLREHGSIRVELDDLAAAWNPASTKRMVCGPCVVEYVLHSDGGVAAQIS
jgi:hypothetical protein